MLYEEFNKMSGCKIDYKFYEEIEEVYELFRVLTKREMVAMYWGYKKNAYGFYNALLTLRTEKFFLDPAIKGMRAAGLTVRADELEQDWQDRASKVIAKVKAMHLDDCKEFKSVA